MAYEPFFPYGVTLAPIHIDGMAANLGISRTQCLDNVFADIAAHHCNCVWVYNLSFSDFTLFYNLCQQYGLKFIPEIGGAYYFPGYLTNKADRDIYVETKMKPAYASLIAQYGDSDVILGWSIYEEPTADLIPELKVIADYIASLDSKHPVIIAQNRQDAAEAYASQIAPFIIPVGCYPFFGNPAMGPSTSEESKAYYTSVIADFSSTAASCGAYFWVMAQGMGIFNGVDKTWHLRQPTPEEIGWEVAEAIRLGATGIFFFNYGSSPADIPTGNTYYGLIDRYGAATQMWQAVSDAWIETRPKPSSKLPIVGCLVILGLIALVAGRRK